MRRRRGLLIKLLGKGGGKERGRRGGFFWVAQSLMVWACGRGLAGQQLPGPCTSAAQPAWVPQLCSPRDAADGGSNGAWNAPKLVDGRTWGSWK